jgi:hypothetical protein
VPRGINFLVLYLSPTLLVLMALMYFVVFRRTLSVGFALAIGVLITLELVAHTLLGSRGAIVGFLQTCLITLLAVHGSIQIKRRLVGLGVALLPIFVAFLVGTFFLSSYIRTARVVDGADLSVGIEMASGAGEAARDRALEVVLGTVASRVGFLDFSAEIIAHRDHYSSVINLPTYGRSIVDNLLTPGIDFFDQPKISNSLLFVYRGIGDPTRSIPTEEYQSDQLGIHGEFYALGGWASLPFFFIAAFLFKRTFDRLSSPNPFVLSMMRVVVLYLFMRLIESFGMDWVLIDGLPLAMAIVLYSYFFAARRVRPHAPAVAAP